MVSYDHCGDDSIRVHHAFSYIVGEGQPYVRHLVVGEEETAVDFGWVKDPGLVVIEAKPPQTAVVPTQEERRSIENRTLRLAAGGAAFAIPAGPQGGVFVCSGPPAGLSLAASRGDVRVSITVFPR